MLDEDKIPYSRFSPRAARQPLHSRNTSSTSIVSSRSTNSNSNKKDYDDEPPPYAYVFYNSLEEKPLPPLPGVRGRGGSSIGQSVQKPLPPLPGADDGMTMIGDERTVFDDDDRTVFGDENRMTVREGKMPELAAWWK
ncbi:hypothetical protein B7494_g4081 [Chlorociboria aeruginascens]|nr:hypothetical protein B7494_g4081 [Chlorociboria aeruginascens]